MTNEEIAAILEGTGRLLELQQANPFRVRSYRNAADSVRRLTEPLSELYHRGGEDALRELEGVGARLASSLREIVETGKLGLRERLEGELRPQQLLSRVPGIGETLAERIHDELGISSLEELEQAAHDGRLSRVEGMGGKRVQGIRDALAGMLSRSIMRHRQQDAGDGPSLREPPVDLILELDGVYRRKARQNQLRRIAPRRFNPQHDAWLPILEQQRGEWEFKLLFSNTKRAHDLGKTDDWVVAYYGSDHQEGQCTIMTAGSGDLKGKRIVRGREGECRRYYQRRGPQENERASPESHE